MISIVVPTIAGREDHYERCVSAYENRTEDEFEIITVKDQPTCGIAWQMGSEKAKGLYLHFTADDLEPALAWDIPARAKADADVLPAPRIWNGFSGKMEIVGPTTPTGFFSRIPFCTMAQWQKIGPMIPLHYYTDNWFSWRAGNAGLPTKETPGYDFKHHWASQGRYTNDKMISDGLSYHDYVRQGHA